MQPPTLTLSASELHLTAPVGITTTATITATNETDTPAFSVAMLDDFAQLPFALSETDCPNMLSPGESCMVTIAFTPDRLGVVDAGGLRLGGSFVPLTGNGEVALTISPSTQDFGTIYLDKNSEPFAFTIQNTTAVSQHTMAYVQPALNGEFLIVDSSCADIAPMGSCSISVIMQGRFLSGERSASLDVSGASATLGGTVSNIVSPQLYHQNSGSFGDVGIYATSASKTLYIPIVNGTHTDLAQIDVGIEGPDAAAFSIRSNSCTSPITDGESCFVEVRAIPAELGMMSAMLTAQTPGVPVHSVSLSANFFDDGPRIAITPNGVVTFAPGQQISFTITNASSYPRFIDSVTVDAPYQMLLNGCAGNVVPSSNSGSCSFTVQLVGSAGGESHPLTIVWNNEQKDTVMFVATN